MKFNMFHEIPSTNKRNGLSGAKHAKQKESLDVVMVAVVDVGLRSTVADDDIHIT